MLLVAPFFVDTAPALSRSCGLVDCASVSYLWVGDIAYNAPPICVPASFGYILDAVAALMGRGKGKFTHVEDVLGELSGRARMRKMMRKMSLKYAIVECAGSRGGLNI